jgi:hypothetical protein
MNNLKLITIFIFLVSSSVFADNYKIIFPAPSKIAFEVVNPNIPGSEDPDEIEFIHSVIGDKTWELCFDTSVDYRSTAAFHSGCDGKGDTVLIANYPGDTVRFAAYSNIDWGSPKGYYYSTESTLMNLTNKTSHYTSGIQTEVGEEAVYVFPDKGPTFGFGNDLTFYFGEGTGTSKYGSCYLYTYEGWDSTNCQSSGSIKLASNVNLKVY